MGSLFFNCNFLKSIPDISNWNTEKVIDMSYIFGNCSIKDLPDISGWNIENVTNLEGIFYQCSSLIMLMI